MKKTYLLYTLLMILVLASCETETTLSDRFISFSGEVSITETRGRVEGTTFANGSSFGVLGYCMAYTSQGSTVINEASGTADWNTKKVFAAPNLFYKQKVEKKEGVWSYVASGQTTQKEVKNGFIEWYPNANNLYTFLAYYPYSDWTIAPTTMTTIGEPTISRTVTVGVGADDIPDIMTAQLIDTKQGGGSVKFNFQHHLTGLKMRFTNYDDTEIIIDKITLKGNFYNKISVGLNSREVSGSQTIDPFTSLNGLMPAFGDGVAHTYETAEVYLLSNGTQFGEGIQIDVVSTSTEHPTESIYLYGTGDHNLNFNPQPGIVYTIDVAYQGEGAVVVSVIADNGGLWEGGTATDSDILFE